MIRLLLSAFLLACGDVLAPPQRRVFFLSLGLAALVFLLLWLGLALLLPALPSTGTPWLDLPLALLGGVAALALTWLLYPAMVLLCLGFFLDGVVSRLLAAHYPGRAPLRPVGLLEVARSALALAALAILLNLLILPFYFWPAINLFIFYALNGYLLGRANFELVSLHRLDKAARRTLWRRHRGRLVAAGVVIAFLLSLPFVDLAAPLIAAAFMLHIVEGMRGEA